MPTATLNDQVRGVLAELLGFKEQRFKHDATGGNPSTTGYAHGPGGFLRIPGVDPDLYNLTIGTIPGLFNELPVRSSLFMNPQFEVLTGFPAGSGDEPATVCDDAPIGGTGRSAIFTAFFGKYKRATREIEIGRLGQLNDRAEPMDLRMVGGPMGRTPFSSMEVQGNILNNEYELVLYERAIEFHRLLSKQLWVGNPANNNGEAYKEFAGLELQVNTGWKDAYTGSAVDNMDPDIKDFNYARLDQNGDDLVTQLSYMHHYLKDKAERTRVTPVRWVLAMRPTLFWEITSIWPCSYFTTVCNGAAGNLTQNIDVADQLRMRDEMRAGSFLLINGERIQVIQDDGISETSNTTDSNVTSGCFASDIFFLPMSVQGGRSTLYLEHFQFVNPSIDSALANGLMLARVTGNGAFLEVPAQTNNCFKLQAEIQPRVVFRAPWLSGRITDVQYCPLQVPDQPFPDDPYFEAPDGVSTRTGPSLTATW